MSLHITQINDMVDVTLTDQAAKKIYSLIEEEEDFDLKLRIFISGGGCSGFQYNFTFDKEISEEDLVVKKTLEEDKEKTVFLLIDSMSLPYLAGATIDYKEDIHGSQFIIKNPNAAGTCGCGNSFDV